jgi:hypothetical protein
MRLPPEAGQDEENQKMPWTRRLVMLAALLGGLAAQVRADDPAAPPPRVRAWQTGALAPDRLEHASFSLAIGLAAGIVSARPAAALAVPLALGTAKELRDRRHTRFDPVDLAADGAGALIAMMATRALTR